MLDEEIVAAMRKRMLSVPIVDGTVPDAFAADVRQALMDAKPSVEALNVLGQQWFRDRDYLRAKACFAMAADDPSPIGAAANLVQCEIRLGQLAMANGNPGQSALFRRACIALADD